MLNAFAGTDRRLPVLAAAYIENRLRLIATEAIAEIGIVWLVPSRGWGALAAAVSCVARNLAVALTTHSGLVPSSTGWVGAWSQRVSGKPHTRAQTSYLEGSWVPQDRRTEESTEWD